MPKWKKVPQWIGFYEVWYTYMWSEGKEEAFRTSMAASFAAQN